ncbi:MAG TPA: hypothetical protein VIV60_01465 [Polyangiaceae bacterium]
MNDRPIDFSSLDPSRHSQSWESRILAITLRAVEQHHRGRTVMDQLARWSRPMLAIAAAVALVGWLGLVITPGRHTHSVDDPSVSLLAWVANDETPSTQALLELVGRSNERQ